jgi:hypothetical protein
MEVFEKYRRAKFPSDVIGQNVLNPRERAVAVWRPSGAITPEKRAYISVSTECRVDRRSSERGDCQFRHGAALELLHP